MTMRDHPSAPHQLDICTLPNWVQLCDYICEIHSFNSPSFYRPILIIWHCGEDVPAEARAISYRDIANSPRKYSVLRYIDNSSLVPSLQHRFLSLNVSTKL